MTALLPWENAERIRIGRLRVRGATESVGIRLALSGILDRTDLRPPGMPPAAVLIVRHMNDPLPGRVAPRHIAGSADPNWERAVRDRVAGCYRRASRPGVGVVPVDAEAVVFADEGELLASLMLDLAGGRMRERWWWRSLGGPLSSASPPALVTVLLDRAAWVPAALALLAGQHRAVEAVRALSPPEALAVLTVLSEVHGIPAIAAATAAPRSPTIAYEPNLSLASSGDADDSSNLLDTDADGQADRRRATGIEPASATEPAAPWAKSLPSGIVPAELGPAQASLLGVALALHHRPAAVRSSSFARALRHWWHVQQSAPARVIAKPGSAGLSTQRAEHAGASGRRNVSPDASWPSQSPASATRSTHAVRSLRSSSAKPLLDPPPRPLRIGDSARTSHAMPSSAASVPSPAAGREPAQPGLPANPVVSGFAVERQAAAEQQASPPDPLAPRVAAGDAVDQSKRMRPDETDTASPPSPPVLTTQFSDSGILLEDGVDTALGGVLFLINAMCGLDLPDCFEAEWRLSSVVGAWGALEALGRALLAPYAGHAADPIWAALAALSGRDTREPLGVGLPRRTAYHLPAAWAVQMPEDANAPTAWAARGNWRRRWSQAGYVLAETRGAVLPEAARPHSEASPRLRFGDAPLADVSGQLTTGIGHPLKRWLALTIPFIQLRITRALGIDLAQESLQTVLLLRPGRLYVTATHVDLVMPMATASLAVRLAGLDRNPGWLVEFGRVVLFHFE